MASDLKNIVIVGASGGIYAARALEKSLPDRKTHRVILIEKNDYAFYHPAALRAGTLPDSESLPFQELDKVFSSSSRHVVLAGTEVTALAEKSVTISKEFEGSNTVAFEYAILATGAAHHAPADSKSQATQQAVDAFKQGREHVKDATSILVVGGGPVGVEYVGEVKHQYPDKKVTIVTRGPTLIDGFATTLGQRLDKSLKARGVEIIYNAGIDVPSDVPSGSLLPSPRSFSTDGDDSKTVEADFVIIATGGKPQTSLVTSSGHPSSALNDKGAIKVDPQTLRVLEPGLGYYFAYGDCCDAPGPKTFVTMKAQAPVVAAQVTSLVQGKGKASKNVWKEPPVIMMVCLGPKDGHGLLFGWSVPSWFVAMVKSKGLFVSSWKSEYLGKA